MTRQEMREFAESQVKWYTNQIEWLEKQNEWITARLTETRKDDREMAQWALDKYPDDEWTRKTYGQGYKGSETKKLINERARNYREIKKAKAHIAQYEQDVIKYTDAAQEPTTAQHSAKAMTWSEFRALAIKNYNNGGDAVIECWTESDFDEYVQEFGPMTQEKALAMFESADEVYRDMTADAQQYREEVATDDIGDDDGDGYGCSYDDYEPMADSRDSDWRPGDAPWKAPGMSPRDFI